MKKYVETLRNMKEIMEKMLIYTWTMGLGKIPGPPGVHYLYVGGALEISRSPSPRAHK